MEIRPGLDLCVERFGDPRARAIVLIHGLGGQLIQWPLALCESLVAAGYQVIRYDLRDSGLSTHLVELGTPDLISILGGRTELAPYRLRDHAEDLALLLDRLRLARADVVGVSMGAMIAQEFAIAHPARARTLVSMLGTTGEPDVGQPSNELMMAILNPGGGEPLEVTAARASSDEERTEVRARVRAQEERLREAGIDDPSGVLRQLAAIVASPPRTEGLRRLTCPALVVHGLADPLVAPSGGFATFRALPRARLLVFPGLGHDLPPWSWPLLRGAILETLDGSEG
jgi:pimeloyl-ACP methyl ester carboxylesterase